MLSSVSFAPMKYVSGKSRPSSDVWPGGWYFERIGARLHDLEELLRALPLELADALGDLLDGEPRREEQLRRREPRAAAADPRRARSIALRTPWPWWSS